MKIVAGTLLSLALAACTHDLAPVATSAAESAPRLAPALITNAGPQTHARISAVVAELAGLTEVTLAAQVFQDNHIVVLEHQRTNMLSETALGRSAPSHIFHLLTDGEHCVIRHLASNGERRLTGVSCTTR